MKVSAVVPTHDRPEPLRRAILSVAGQTVHPVELIVVDDGSKPAVDVDALPELPFPLRVLRHKTPQGPAAARNAGVAAAHGGMVAFLDDDDVWCPRKLEAVLKGLEDHPNASVVISASSTAPSDWVWGWDWGRVPDPIARMLCQQPPSLDGVVVGKDLHLACPLDPEFQGAEDLDYLIRLAKTGATFIESPAVLAIIGSASTTVGIDKRIAGRMRLLDRHPEILADPAAKAFFFMRLGHQYRRNGNRARAIEAYAKSFAAQPNRSAAKGLALSVLPERVQAQLLR